MVDHPYAGEGIGLATIHAKERAIAPPFRRLLGAKVVVAPNLDTDTLGTFTGEVPRPDALVETSLLKAELVFRSMNIDCAIASEGSYGPIDRLPLVAGGLEIMAFVDRKRGIRLIETLTTHRTNWQSPMSFEVGDAAVPQALKALGFPDFGVFVIRGSVGGHTVKDLTTLEEVVAAVDREARLSEDGKALIVADMRAHRNPTRMKVLRALAWKLARRLAALCPKCKAPGFGHLMSPRGLPCENCGEPTHWVDFEIDGCACCGHAIARSRKDGRRTAPRLSCKACRN